MSIRSDWNPELRIEAIVFDFDGTLTAPGSLDFHQIRQALGCPDNSPVLEYIDKIDDSLQKAKLYDQLVAFELAGARRSEPNQDIETLVAYLKLRQVPMGIVSRNGREAIMIAFDNFKAIMPTDFQFIVSRDDELPYKPNPDTLLWAAKKMGAAPENLLMVGDYKFDLEAGHAAGCPTALLAYFADDPPKWTSQADITATSPTDLMDQIRLYLPLPAGKFPNDLLKQYLDEVRTNDPELLINPGIGEDTAAVDTRNHEVMVLKSDPITFATDAIGNYAVLVNANDIATSGAKPRWFLATILFPLGITPANALHILEELRAVCAKEKIVLCGGHTEITDAVNRSVISGMMLGTVTAEKLLDKRNMRPGDQILMTKALAVEGTALIAREFADRLIEEGVTVSAINQASTLLSEISILPEAQIAAQQTGTSAMHDVTEGGLAMALAEFATAGKQAIAVDMDKISILPETAAFCRALKIDPLGLIGSGSLLIACRPETVDDICKAIRNQGITTTIIGEVLPRKEGILAHRSGKPASWPTFDADEITRLF